MRADGSPWIRLGGAGEDPAVGRALTHLRVSVAGLSIKSVTMMGSELELWFRMAPYCGCCVCFCVCTSVCVCHFLLIKLDVGHQASCRLSSLYSVQWNYAATLDVTSALTYFLLLLSYSIQTSLNRWLIWMGQQVSAELVFTTLSQACWVKHGPDTAQHLGKRLFC